MKKNDKGGFLGYNVVTIDDYEDSDSDEDLDSDDEDLDALYEFSVDFQELRNRYINQLSYEPRLLTSTFSCSFFQEERAKMKEQKKEDSVKLLDDILMNQAYKKMKFKEKRKNENNRVNNIQNNKPEKKEVANENNKEEQRKNKNIEDDTISVGNTTRM